MQVTVPLLPFCKYGRSHRTIKYKGLNDDIASQRESKILKIKNKEDNTHYQKGRIRQELHGEKIINIHVTSRHNVLQLKLTHVTIRIKLSTPYFSTWTTN